MKCRVTKHENILKDGFSYSRSDGVRVSVMPGDIVESDDITPFERASRIRDGHIEPLSKEKPAEEKAPPAPAVKK